MFAKKWRLQLQLIRKPGKAQGKTRDLKSAQDSIIDRANRTPLDQMRMVHGFRDRQDGRDWYPACP